MILYEHVPLADGEISDADRDAFYNAIKNYNVKAIFSGHWHDSELDMFHDIPDFVVPSAHGPDDPLADPAAIMR